MTHQMKLNPGPFKKIKDGLKIIESRMYDEKRRNINIGDEIEFLCNTDPSQKILTRVEALYRYKIFDELFSDFPSKSFGGESKKDLLEEIEKFYPIEEQKKYGVIGIKIKLL
jgi:ASC-1-like (ASCH) protein